MNYSTALLTDQYELTMVQAALRSGAANRYCTFEVFTRRLPAGRRYGVVAGTGRLLEGLERFRFGQQELDYLDQHSIVDDDTLNFLAGYRFGGDIIGYAEGETYFPHSPVLQVSASFAEACLLETYVLSVMNHDSAIAAAGSRMVTAAGGPPESGGRPCVEMGSRRTHERSATSAARAAAAVGFAATSNLEAGRRWGVPTLGTSAHAFTLLHDTEEEAFAAQVEAFGPGTTLLVDTYEVEAAVRTAVRIAGAELGAVRLDSGDLLEQAHEVRRLLDSLGNTATRIIVSSDLDEHAIAGLAAAPVDSYGVGTRLVTGSGAPTASMVYKLVQRHDDAGTPVAVEKSSVGKASAGGKKQALRSLDGNGRAEAEIIAARTPLSQTEYSGRGLQVPLVLGGEVQSGHTGPEGLHRAAQRHRASFDELPAAAHRLSDGEPVIPTVFA
nr:nicotinate phosphoribosyltransferase [Nesterenkonia muleiensis]